MLCFLIFPTTRNDFCLLLLLIFFHTSCLATQLCAVAMCCHLVCSFAAINDALPTSACLCVCVPRMRSTLQHQLKCRRSPQYQLLVYCALGWSVGKRLHCYCCQTTTLDKNVQRAARCHTNLPQ